MLDKIRRETRRETIHAGSIASHVSPAPGLPTDFLLDPGEVRSVFSWARIDVARVGQVGYVGLGRGGYEELDGSRLHSMQHDERG